MDIIEFVEKFKAQFIDCDDILLTSETDFRTIESYDSLTGMSVLVMVKDEFNIDIPDETYKTLKTPKEVFDFIQLKKWN